MKKLLIPVVLVTGILCLAPVRGHEGRAEPPCASRSQTPERDVLPVEWLRWRSDAL